jgi:hypothetical protein
MIEQPGNGSHRYQEYDRPCREKDAEKPDQKSHRQPILMTRQSLQSRLLGLNAKFSLNTLFGGTHSHSIKQYPLWHSVRYGTVFVASPGFMIKLWQEWRIRKIHRTNVPQIVAVSTGLQRFIGRV